MSEMPAIHQGEVLRQHLNKHGIGADDLAKLLEKSRQTAYLLFQRQKFEKNDIALFCLLFNLTPMSFGLPGNYFETPLTPRRPQQEQYQPFMDCHAFSERLYNGKATEADFPNYLEEYFNTIIKYVQESTDTIYAYHYLNKSQQAAWVTEARYEEKLNRLYAAIEEAISQRGVRYRRVFSLPFSLQSDAAAQSKPPLEIITSAIAYTFPATFQHYLRCLKLNDYSSGPDVPFELYGIPIPSRQFNYWIMDNKTCLTEYDRTIKYGITRPDVLFVDTINLNIYANDPVKVLRDSYLKDLDDLTRGARLPTNYKIDWQLLNEALVEEDRGICINLEESYKNIRNIQAQLGEGRPVANGVSFLAKELAYESRRQQQLHSRKDLLEQLINWLLQERPGQGAVNA